MIVVSNLPDATAALRIGEKLQQTLKTPIPVQGEACWLGLTIGYALAPVDGCDLGLLLSQADEAMYLGKRAGKQQLRRATSPLISRTC